MSFAYKSPETDQEWRDYFHLRWLILRAPWQQPLGSEQDELETSAFHIMALGANKQIVGTGRLHRLTDTSAQVRYMAVSPEHQGLGIGARLLSILEQQATNWSCQEIRLNARDTCLGFYLKYGYEVLFDGPSLFGSITHKHMRKRINKAKQTVFD